MSSIRTRLLAALLAAVIVAGAAAGLAAYLVIGEEVNDLLDAQLIALARSLRHGRLALPSEPMASLAAGEENDFVILLYRPDGALQSSSVPGVRLPMPPGEGFHTVRWHDQPWRAYETHARGHIAVVAQPQEARDEVSASIVWPVILPTLALIPVLALLIWLAVRRGLRPLEDIASAVGRRNPSSLDPLPAARLPAELQPLVAALNDLLERLARALQVQRDFVADAAHELRTPLTAIDLQAQLVERSTTPVERAAAVKRLREGLHRAAHLVQQLLVMARQDPGTAPRPEVPVALGDVARQAMGDLIGLAQAKGIDLGLAHEDAVTLPGDREGLRILADNLLDNAIRYTPPGGRVDVSVRAGDASGVLEVTDTGPGIPPEERERVLQRFYRRPGGGAAGSGLGLAIVQGIADRHGAALQLDSGPDGRGLRVRVSFPGAKKRTC